VQDYTCSGIDQGKRITCMCTVMFRDRSATFGTAKTRLSSLSVARQMSRPWRMSGTSNVNFSIEEQKLGRACFPEELRLVHLLFTRPLFPIRRNVPQVWDMKGWSQQEGGLYIKSSRAVFWCDNWNRGRPCVFDHSDTDPGTLLEISEGQNGPRGLVPCIDCSEEGICQ